ncbi:MAG: hypothetical protein IJS82_06875 [Paludibacteraceae bacterium]|nr:hypothetical protein [Paludibacteraceae bacterium]
MKKGIYILLGVVCLCVASVSAVEYGSPYRGAGRNGYIYTSTSHRMHHSGGSMASMPSMSMGSVSGYASMGTTRGYAYAGVASSYSSSAAAGSDALMQVRTLTTCASSLSGGVMSSQTYSGFAGGSGPRKGNGYPGIPGCDECVDKNGDGVCDICEADEYDECDCADESSYCWCPLECDGKVMVFMALLAAGYMAWKKRKAQTSLADVHPTDEI